MDAEHVGRTGEIPVGIRQDAGNEAALELATGIAEPDALLNHFFNQPFQLLVHADLYSRSSPVRSWKACTYFSRVRSTTSPGRLGTGGCLFH